MSSDPSGNYAGYKAHAIGANNANANSKLKGLYKVDDAQWVANFDLKQALEMAVQVLSKSMDSTSLTSEKLEFATVTRDEKSGKVVFRALSKPEVDRLIASVPIAPEAE